MPRALDNPDGFAGKFTLSAYEPYPMVQGSQFSSLAPASAAVVRWVQPQPLAFKNVAMVNTFAAGVPGATSQASTGSEGYSYAVSAFLYSRQDYGANSSNLTYMSSASFGLSASMAYSSTSQRFGLSWVTDTTGGASNFTTSSNDAGWSNFASGVKSIYIPFQTQLNAGEYWMAFQHSSTTATSNSNVTLLSASQLQAVAQQGLSAGLLGGSTTVSTGGFFMDFGAIGGTPVTSATMAASTIVNVLRPVWFAMSNL